MTVTKRISRKNRPSSRESVARSTEVRDLELLRAIEAQLPPHGSKLGLPNLEVTVEKGFVVLAGTVRTMRDRERLRRFIMGLRGVKALKDQLVIEPWESLADQQIALHVRQALDAHSGLPTGTATVHVREGVCALHGHVRSAEEKHLAVKVAAHCRGVREVEDHLTVDLLDEISDEATARAVKCALAYCQDFDTADVTVSCADGRVVLRGTVPTIMDRMLAEEMTRIQSGVRRVENHIQVDGESLLGPGNGLAGHNGKASSAPKSRMLRTRKGRAVV